MTLEKNEKLMIPAGKLSSYHNDPYGSDGLEDRLKKQAVLNKLSRGERIDQKKIEQIADALHRGEQTAVTSSGALIPKSSVHKLSEDYILVPKGKLAAFGSYGNKSIYWYKNYPDLFEEEKRLMRSKYPGFKMSFLEDGRICYKGVVRPTTVRSNARWELMLVVENNHPNNNSFGGSVRVYSLNPSLKKLERDLGHIPHLLYDPNGEICLCTAMKEDFHTSSKQSTSIATCLSWAVKWITVFELWLAGAISNYEFENHTF